jgi:hypothetical protein
MTTGQLVSIPITLIITTVSSIVIVVIVLWWIVGDVLLLDFFEDDRLKFLEDSVSSWSVVAAQEKNRAEN